MKKNLMKEKLSRGGVAVGILFQEPAIQAAEIVGLLGFDWLLIDCEHSPMNVESAARLVMAAEIRGITPLVRVPQNLPEIILRYMDVGAMGVMIPGAASADDVQKAVRAVKYPPEGERGLAGIRAADYGVTAPLGEYVKVANQETMVLGLIESREGVENVEEILAVQGLDGVAIGTNDLSKSLGVPGQGNHPLVVEAVNRILAAGKKMGKPVGAGVRGGETPKQYIEQGYRIVSTILNSLVLTSAKEFLDNARS
jgi:4-hydroxy-2-oxoheptanedioate aldolase